MESGAQFVITLGTTLMLEWCALRWDTPDEVHRTAYLQLWPGR